MEAAVACFENIKVVEYHFGLELERSHSKPQRILRDIFTDVAQALPDKVSSLVLRHAKEILQPTENTAVRQHSLALFHGVLVGVLSNTSRRGPLTVRIHTKHYAALQGPLLLDSSSGSWLVSSLPFNNELKTLEMTFAGRNKDRRFDFSIELRIFCRRDFEGQFSNLTRLQVSGTGLHQRNSVCINDWGKSGLSPHWPHLRDLDLAYVQIHDAFVSWVKPLHIRLRIHDAFWASESIQGFCTGSNLESADISGVQVISFQPEADEVPLGAATSAEMEETLQRASGVDVDGETLYAYLFDIAEEISYADLCYLVAKDEEEAQELLAQYSQYCRNVWIDRPVELTFAQPDDLNKFFVNGGECPLDFRCVWGDSWAL
ncbi:hypothetical protein PTMSG1_04437 [Pyrenophora teres f. maculata]|nr:hypothetical protein PTMSG1_04437 [Pyrenophora teres f. maculata]